MKLRRFLFLILLCLSAPVFAAQAPKLETLLAEYKKARGDVLGKLSESYASRADALAEQYRTATNLDGADRAQSWAKRLRNPDERESAVVADTNVPPGDPLVALQDDYAKSRQENLTMVYTFYATNATNLRKELLKQKDQAGADVLTTFLEKIKPAGAKASPKPSPTPTPATRGKPRKGSSK